MDALTIDEFCNGNYVQYASFVRKMKFCQARMHPKQTNFAMTQSIYKFRFEMESRLGCIANRQTFAKLNSDHHSFIVIWRSCIENRRILHQR